MRTITENFNIILARQKAIAHDYYALLNPPASMDDIVRVEKSLDLTFSAELIELYSLANGKRTKRWKSFFPSYDFIDLDSTVQTYQFCENLFDIRNNPDYFTIYNDNHNPVYIPQRKMLPVFASDNGNLYWVDLNEHTKYYNQILWTCVDGTPIYEFTSLTTMFQTIAECYENDVYYFADGNVYVGDKKQWALIGKKYNPGLIIWDDCISNYE